MARSQTLNIKQMKFHNVKEKVCGVFRVLGDNKCRVIEQSTGCNLVSVKAYMHVPVCVLTWPCDGT